MAKIYVACLASYNNGRHHGDWFDLEDYADADDLRDDIQKKVLITSPYPNVMVECPDCEGEGNTECGGIVTPCERCKSSGKVSSSEEWAIHDYDDEDGIFRNMGEYASLDELMHHQEMMNNHKGWAAFVGEFGDSVTEQNYEDAVQGEYDSFEDFVQQYCEEVYGWKGNEEFYGWIDWERAARDFSCDFTYVDGWVFRCSW